LYYNNLQHIDDVRIIIINAPVKHCTFYGAILCWQKMLTVEMPRNP